MKSQLFSPLVPSFAFAGFSFPKYVWTLPPRSLAKRKERHSDAYPCGATYHSPRPEQVGKGCGFYLGSDSPVSLRWQWCDEVPGVRIRHTGWFCDEFQGEKIRGIVAHLPRSRGFLAGWSMGEGMASEWDGDIHDTIEDAARAANSLAEDAAQRQLEYEEAERERLEQEEIEEIEPALYSAE